MEAQVGAEEEEEAAAAAAGEGASGCAGTGLCTFTAAGNAA